MKRHWVLAACAAMTLILALPSGTVRAFAKQAFGFQAANISGFSTFSAEMTGGGAYDPATGFVNAAGGFRCLSDITATGNPFDGCKAGEGVRWDTSALVLVSTPFKCTASDTAQFATTSGNTVVLAADFYRQGDGNDESFRAKMIVSATDLPATPERTSGFRESAAGRLL